MTSDETLRLAVRGDTVGARHASPEGEARLSAKAMRTKLSVASTIFAALFVAPCCPAAPAGGPAPAGQASSTLAPTSREDVDLMLREARAAIAQGKFDQAEKLVSRAENAHVRYSMFHIGA